MNKYEVEGVIDEGAYGIVLKATNRDTQQTVAIKKFKEADEDPKVKGPIQRQIRMLKALKSTNVVELLQAFRRKGKVYLVFEHMEKNLLQLIEEHTEGIPADIAIKLTYQIVKCLCFMHSKDIIHRDLKPQNLLIGPEFQLKLCDFGFARLVGQPDEELTDYVATRWYRSPQLLIGDHYGKPLDMWSLGCILSEMLTGEPLFPGENQIDQIHLIRKSMGDLTENQQKKLNSNQRFSNVKFPEIRTLDTIQNKLKGKASKNAISFIESCLKMNPAERLTAEEALHHILFLNHRAKSMQSQQITERQQYTSPPQKRNGNLTEKTNYRIKTIYNSKSNDNVWKVAGASRFDKTKLNLLRNRESRPNDTKIAFQLTVTQLSPDSNRSPSRQLVLLKPKNKMSLNMHTQKLIPDVELPPFRQKNNLRSQHDKIPGHRVQLGQLSNHVNKFQKAIRNYGIENGHIDFSITGQAKTLLRKL